MGIYLRDLRSCSGEKSFTSDKNLPAVNKR